MIKFSRKYFLLIAFFFVISPIVFSNEAFAHYGEQLSGYGTAKIDGIRSAGEWDNAQVIPVFGGKSDSDLLLVMNDEKNLYMALYVVDNVLRENDGFGIRFDNNHDGVLDTNDDLGGVTGFGLISDSYFDGKNWTPDSKIDGEGAAQREGDRNFMEYSKPLNSGDEHDFSLSIGDKIGFCLTYVRDGISMDSTQFGPACSLLVNEQKLYGDILLVPYSISWHGLMAMDADKRNIDKGDIINYQGYLYGDQLIKDQFVYITVSELDTGKIILKQYLTPSTEPVDYFENTAWKFTFNVDTSQNDFKYGMTYVVEANYAEKSTKLNFLIKTNATENLDKKASDAGKAIVVAGNETGELIVEAGKEVSKTIVDAGGKAVEKGTIVGETVVEKSTETGKLIAEKGSEGIEEIQEKGGGCLIATAAFGSELAPQVQFLREIRDNTVMSTVSGSAFMTGFNQIYYSFSPIVADYERENPVFQTVVKLFITPMISTLSIMTFADDGNEIHVLILGSSIIALNLGIYIVAPTVFGYSIRKYQKHKSEDG